MCHSTARALALGCALAAALAGCGTLDSKRETAARTAAMRVAPESPPQRSITGFSGALRCMDSLMITYGVRDVSVLVEDIVDQTKKVNAGTKDMLISAVSDMSKRSRAVRLVAFGPDSGNLISLLQAAERKHPYAVIPSFDIKGSITQLDENVMRKQTDAGVGINPYLNIGAASTAASSILGLDLTVLSTDDLSVVPGVTSRNAVVIYKEGTGYDGEAAIRKFGINYSVSLAKSEGQSQALRNLVELAAVELFGKLTKVPYWMCLGGDAGASEVSTEIGDWYDAMFAHPGELVAWFQHQLRLRGYYAGPSDGEPNEALRDAVARYRAALGMSPEPKIDLAFFTAYLSADHARVMQAQPPQALPEPQAPAPEAAPERAGFPEPGAGVEPDASGFTLSLYARDHARRFRRNQPVNLVLWASHDAHVYCYMHDEHGRIQRFYPNRYARDSLLGAETALQLPGAMRFQISASAGGASETVVCFGAQRDPAPALPRTVTGEDFENLSVATLDEVRAAFLRATGGDLAEGVFHVHTY